MHPLRPCPPHADAPPPPPPFPACLQVFLKVLQSFVSELRAGGPVRPGTGAEPASALAGSGSSSDLKPSAAAGNEAGAGGDPKQQAPPAPKPAPAPPAPSRHTVPTSLSLTETFYAKPADLYSCFTEQGRVMGFSQSPASVDARAGGTFSWFGGSVLGEFTELVPGKELVMKWKFSTWADEVFSTVRERGRTGGWRV